MGCHSSVGRALQLDAEAIESNSIEVLKFFWVNLQLLELQLPLMRIYLQKICFSSVHIIFILGIKIYFTAS